MLVTEQKSWPAVHPTQCQQQVLSRAVTEAPVQTSPVAHSIQYWGTRCWSSFPSVFVYGSPCRNLFNPFLMVWYKLLSQFPTGPSSRNSLHRASVLNQPPTNCNNCCWAAVLQSSVSCCTFTSSTAFTDLHLPFSLLIHELKCSEAFQPFKHLPARLLHPLTLLSRPLPHCLKLQSLHFTRQEDQHCTQQLQMWVSRGFQEQAATPSILFSTPLWSHRVENIIGSSGCCCKQERSQN